MLQSVVGWLADGVRVDSVLVVDDDVPRHVYRLVGAPHDGLILTSLSEVAGFAAGGIRPWPGEAGE